MHRSLRIIAGTARGRVFEAPDGWDTRPTLDRVKEAVFGMLQFEIPGSRILDLFSGSGNLGLEAASRGAALAVLNDSDARCVRLIGENARRLGLDSICRVMHNEYMDALSVLYDEGLRFDIVFLDAPYQTEFAHLAAERLFQTAMIRAGGYVVVEHAAELPVPAVTGSHVLKTRKYGKCAVTVLQREDDV